MAKKTQNKNVNQNKNEMVIHISWLASMFL